MTLFTKNLFFIVLLLQMQIVNAERSSETNYYSVYGKNADDLISEFTNKGHDGFAGYTYWEIKTNYHYESDNKSCRLTDYNVDLIISYTMPKWKDKSGANRKLQKKWDKWYKSLLAHEKTHGSHGEKAYKELKRQFSSQSSKKNCKKLERTINSFTNKIINKYLKEDKLYDKRTNHGETEGASTQLLR